MITIRTLAMSLLALVLSTHAVEGQDKAQYRGFTLGSTLAAVSGQVNAPASDAKVIHARPAMIQDLQWSSLGSGFQLVVTSVRLDALARTADTQAILLDEREAPLREVARQRKDEEDAHMSQEKARLANKASFRP